MASFEEKVARMKRIFRGEETYGEGKPADQAKRFRADQMMDEIIKRACDNSKKPEKPVELLISLAGFSPATTILAYEILRPSRVLVIHSEHAQESIDVIGNHLINKGDLNFSDFDRESCRPADPLSIYEIIKRHFLRRRK